MIWSSNKRRTRKALGALPFFSRNRQDEEPPSRSNVAQPNHAPAPFASQPQPTRMTQRPSPPAIAAPPLPPAPPKPPAPRPRRSWTGDATWVTAGGSVVVAGHTIAGGMVWIGATMSHDGGGYSQTDPALINPHLPVDMRRPDWEGTTIGYWPSYADINNRQRAAYLSWLAHGRRSPGIPISYVFLFFYGLERRVLDAIDMHEAQTGAGLAELGTMRAELDQLRHAYAREATADYPANSFDRYVSSLIDVIDAVIAAAAPGLPAIPAHGPDTWQMPLAFKVALGRMARDGVAVPADWALAWSSLHARIYSRTPQRRCPKEFEKLFTLRYTARFGDGLRLKSVKQNLHLDYHGASSVSRFRPLEIGDLPDVSDQERPVQALSTLAEETSNDLDAFSRWLGRHPEDRTSLAALATLPRELLNLDQSPALRALIEWADAAVAGRDSAVIDSRPLLALWGAAKCGKADAVALANLLQKLGYGVEPDARCEGPTLGPGPMVVFHAESTTPNTAGPSYGAATLVAHLGVTVAAADGHIDQSELDQITNQLRSALSLTDGEHQRLAAHIAWLSATGVKLTGLKKRLEPLTLSERETLADFVASVAAADGVITATESRAVDKIHTLLGLDPADAARRLHVAMTTRAAMTAPGPPAATEPVTIRPASRPTPGHPIPPPAEPTADAYAGRHTQAAADTTDTTGGFALDEQLVVARRADTAQVAALLTRIFDDEDPTSNEPPYPASDTDSASRPDGPGQTAAPLEGPTGAALDAGHRALLGALAERNSWYRVEFDKLAGMQHLSPQEAMDSINHASIAASGRALVTGVERLTVDTDAHLRLYALQPPVAQTSAQSPPNTSADPAITKPSSGPSQPAGRVVRYAGLDEAHSALLTALAAQTTWFRVQFETLAADYGLLPDAAFERLNDAALDTCDDLLLDGAERLTLNQYALTEMLA